MVYQNGVMSMDCLCRKDLHGVGLYEVEKSLRRPLEVAQSLVGLAKGGGKHTKWRKMAKSTFCIEKLFLCLKRTH